jgi:hypothetical protein
MPKTHRCESCRLPIRSGEPRYTAMEPLQYWHWDCREEQRRELDRMLANLPLLQERINRSLASIREVLSKGEKK